jgi:ATP-dependent Clp protease ATP-binding subunit ClpC
VFERFTERARQVVVAAQEESAALRHASLGTEHLLLGLVRERTGLAARALDALGVAEQDVRSRVVRELGMGPRPAPSQIPFTPAAKRALEAALTESLSLGHNYIGTEHLLLGLVKQDDAAARILGELGVSAEAARRETVRLLSRPSPPAQQVVQGPVVGQGHGGPTAASIHCLVCGVLLHAVPTEERTAQSAEVRHEATLVCESCGATWDVSMDIRWKRRD